MRLLKSELQTELHDLEIKDQLKVVKRQKIRVKEEKRRGNREKFMFWRWKIWRKHAQIEDDVHTISMVVPESEERKVAKRLADMSIEEKKGRRELLF